MARTASMAATVSIDIAAPPERVFDAWLDPKTAARFMAAGSASSAQLRNDPREGGAFSLLMRGEVETLHEGRYVVIDRPRRLVFTWNSEHTKGLSLVTIDFHPTGAGVRVDLLHEGLPTPEAAEAHRRGWSSILRKLMAESAGTGTHVIEHRVLVQGVTREEVFAAFASVEGIAAWWTRFTSGDPDPGGILRFRFPEIGFDFEVIERVAPEWVLWRCVDGFADWLGTEIAVALEAVEDGVVVVFRHRLWREITPFMHHCATQWAYFLFGLKARFETGGGTSFGSPGYARVSDMSPPPVREDAALKG